MGIRSNLSWSSLQALLTTLATAHIFKINYLRIQKKSQNTIFQLRIRESGLTLNLYKLIRQGLFRPGHCWESIFWTRVGSGEQVGSVCYEAYMGGDCGRVRLRYTTTRAYNGEKRDSDYTIALEATPQPLGGRRWWFVCPKTGSRVGKLHLPSGAFTFASRRAYRLGYRSQRFLPAQDGAESFDPAGFLRQMRREAGFATVGADGLGLHAAVRGFPAFDGQGDAGGECGRDRRGARHAPMASARSLCRAGRRQARSLRGRAD